LSKTKSAQVFINISMAGGTSIWASRDAKTDPREIFNGRLLYLLITVAWAGCFYGFDSGNIVFLIGAVMQMIANYDVLLAGRFIGGMGVGASSMLNSQFFAENAPKSVRGSMTAKYNLMIITSPMLAFWINYGVSLWKNADTNNTQWRASMGIQLIPGALMSIMIPFMPETPRYLINHGKAEKGLYNIVKMRKLPVDHPYIQLEYQEIVAQANYEQEVSLLNSASRLCPDYYRSVKAIVHGPSSKTSSRTRAMHSASSWLLCSSYSTSSRVPIA
jgi:MFS family permease